MTDQEPKVYSPEEVEARIAESGLEGWYFDADGGWLRRKYATDGWQATLMLVNAVGFLCEAAWHHADLSVAWRQGLGQAQDPLGGRDHRQGLRAGEKG